MSILSTRLFGPLEQRGNTHGFFPSFSAVSCHTHCPHLVSKVTTPFVIWVPDLPAFYSLYGIHTHQFTCVPLKMDTQPWTLLWIRSKQDRELTSSPRPSQFSQVPAYCHSIKNTFLSLPEQGPSASAPLTFGASSLHWVLSCALWDDT